MNSLKTYSEILRAFLSFLVLGIAVATITDAAIESQRKMDFDSRDKTMRYMVKHMGRFLMDLSRNHMMSTSCKRFWYAVYGNYLVIVYMIIKVRQRMVWKNEKWVVLYKSTYFKS